MILIYSESTDSKVTVSAPVWNELYPPRRYQFTGHFLEMDGPGHLVEFDSQDICKIPGYRLATASEQNQWATLKRKQSRLVEAAPAPAPAAPASKPVPAPVVSPEPPAEAPSADSTASAESAAPASAPAAEKDN